MNKDLKFICQLDGYNYYLGDVVAENVNWFEAKVLVEKLGDGWELPSREIAILAHKRFSEEMKSIDGWYWLRDEHSSSLGYAQHSAKSQQDFYDKNYDNFNFVRPVLKIEV